jgi:hypothetical protein
MKIKKTETGYPTARLHPTAADWKIVLPIILAALGVVICLAGLNLAGGQSTALAAGRLENTNSTGETFQAATTISTTFLPLVSKDYDFYPKLPTGSLSPRVTEACTGIYAPNADCFYSNVSCPGINGNITTHLRVTDPTTATLKGTMIFFSGWTGGYWWAETWLPNNIAMLEHLRADGFRTVEVKWIDSVSQTWWAAWSHAGMAKLGCRPATVMKWVYDNLHTDQSLPYCATGHSNGASQLALTMVFYGMDELLEAAVFESGPNWARIDQNCLCDDPAYSNICYSGPNEGEVIDYSYGERFKLNPCSNKDVSYKQAFIYDSLVNDTWRFQNDTTNVSFIFGLGDKSKTHISGKLYYEKLISVSSTPVFSTTVVGAGPFVTDTALGAQVMEDTLKNTCTIP